MISPDDTHRCPNCGAPLPLRFAAVKMLDCDSCGSACVYEDGALRAAGERGVMLEAPSLIRLQEPVRVAGVTYMPTGQLRFDYGAGWWDEFWCLDPSGGEGTWISADEGDYAVERVLEPHEWPAIAADAELTLGLAVRLGHTDFTLAETDQATCIALRGSVPEVIELGETHTYANFTTLHGDLLSLEHWPGGQAWHRGRWVDPFAIHSDARQEAKAQW